MGPDFSSSRFKAILSWKTVNTKPCSHTLWSLQKVQVMFLSHPSVLPGAQIPHVTVHFHSVCVFRIKSNFTRSCNQKVAAAYHAELHKWMYHLVLRLLNMFAFSKAASLFALCFVDTGCTCVLIHSSSHCFSGCCVSQMLQRRRETASSFNETYP